jgi:hypothetical protein
MDETLSGSQKQSAAILGRSDFFINCQRVNKAYPQGELEFR